MIFYFILGTVILGDVLWLAFTLRRSRAAWQKVAAAMWGALQLGAVAGMLLARSDVADFYNAAPRWLHSIVLIWHLLCVLPWLAWQILRGLWALPLKLARTRPPTPSEEGMSRRQFLGATTAFIPPAFTIGSAAIGEMQLDDFRVRKVTVPVAALPPALEGVTIAHLTDLHAGRLTRGKVMERIVAETNGLNPDIIALTGDLINDSLSAMPAVVDLVGGLRARELLVSCEGNHDLIDSPREFYRQAEKGGLNLLRNETASLRIRGQLVQVLGLPWTRGAGRMADSVRELLAKRNPDAWQLMLAHHPHAWDLMDDIPLTLSGHTHGGQLMLNEVLGAGPMVFRYWSGIYRKERRALAVSNGVGNWFPVRTAAPAEILHITLTRATS